MWADSRISWTLRSIKMNALYCGSFRYIRDLKMDFRILKPIASKFLDMSKKSSKLNYSSLEFSNFQFRFQKSKTLKELTSNIDFAVFHSSDSIEGKWKRDTEIKLNTFFNLYENHSLFSNEKMISKKNCKVKTKLLTYFNWFNGRY